MPQGVACAGFTIACAPAIAAISASRNPSVRREWCVLSIRCSFPAHGSSHRGLGLGIPSRRRGAREESASCALTDDTAIDRLSLTHEGTSAPPETRQGYPGTPQIQDRVESRKRVSYRRWRGKPACTAEPA